MGWGGGQENGVGRGGRTAVGERWGKGDAPAEPQGPARSDAGLRPAECSRWHYCACWVKGVCVEEIMLDYHHNYRYDNLDRLGSSGRAASNLRAWVDAVLGY
jgi:hypothetical protein